MRRRITNALCKEGRRGRKRRCDVSRRAPPPPPLLLLPPPNPRLSGAGKGVGGRGGGDRRATGQRNNCLKDGWGRRHIKWSRKLPSLGCLHRYEYEGVVVFVVGGGGGGVGGGGVCVCCFCLFAYSFYFTNKHTPKTSHHYKLKRTSTVFYGSYRTYAA